MVKTNVPLFFKIHFKYLKDTWMELFPKIVMVPKTSGRRSLMLDALLMKYRIDLDIKPV